MAAFHCKVYSDVLAQNMRIANKEFILNKRF